MGEHVRPALVMIAGPNGSGKSTLTDRLQVDGVAFGEYINADEIEKTQVGPDRLSRSRKARMIADERRARCVSDGRSFSFETVMSHPSKVELLRTARALGFEVVMYFVATADPDINVRRVRERVAAGGHSVDERAIRERYGRTLSHLYSAARIAERSFILDNTGERATAGKGRPLRLVTETSSDGTRVTVARTAVDLPAWVLNGLIKPAEADRALLDTAPSGRA